MQKFLAGAILACVFGATLAAQSAGSQISGEITDQTGAAVAGAQITVVNTDTSASRAVETAADGTYLITNLPTGPYRLQVVKSGFTTYNQSGIVLQVNTNPSINVSLKVGSVSEQVEVTANTVMLETDSNAVGQVIDQRRVVDLPLNGRNVAQLITLSGGAVTGTAGGLASNLNYPSAVAVAVAGSQPNGTNYFLDGGNSRWKRAHSRQTMAAILAAP